MDARRFAIARAVVLSVGAAFFSPLAAQQLRLPDLQAQFDRESNPVRKAKLLQKLGDAQFLEAHREQHNENYAAVEKIYESYRDNVKIALNSLRGSRPDAERHSDGYRQLHIQLRKGLRDIDETIIGAPSELRPLFESVRTGLVAVDDDLIKLLFPRRKPGSAKPAGAPETQEAPAQAVAAVTAETRAPQTSIVEKPPQGVSERQGPLRPDLSHASSNASSGPSFTTVPDNTSSGAPESSNHARSSNHIESDQADASSDFASLNLPPDVEVPNQSHRDKKDYLSELEADKIRDAETSNQRIKLLLAFADDRLKKFQYELAHPSASGRHAEMLVFLMNAYAGCLDDAAEYIDVGREKQENVHAGINEMLAKGKEFLVILEKLSSSGAEHDLYKETLDDAIEGTHDAIRDAQKAKQDIAPPPVRRPK
jgi:hypothetical protein